MREAPASLFAQGLGPAFFLVSPEVEFAAVADIEAAMPCAVSVSDSSESRLPVACVMHAWMSAYLCVVSSRRIDVSPARSLAVQLLVGRPP